MAEDILKVVIFLEMKRKRDSTAAEIQVEISDDGIRRILPYWYTYATHTKQRWIGMTLEAVYEREFRDRPMPYYKRAISEGRSVLLESVRSLLHADIELLLMETKLPWIIACVKVIILNM